MSNQEQHKTNYIVTGARSKPVHAVTSEAYELLSFTPTADCNSVWSVCVCVGGRHVLKMT